MMSIVCLSVYRSVGLHNSKTVFHIAKIFVHVLYGSGLVLLWQRYTLFTSGFVDDVIFSHSGSVA